eukprot:GHVH01000985.1.p1 GENE.GHVH01000985.1~~GHVH01000985.1.p1  ORF type:complete len:716 (-),score=49.56 GHVH01000985.1:359-2506(-)
MKSQSNFMNRGGRLGNAPTVNFHRDGLHAVTSKYPATHRSAHSTPIFSTTESYNHVRSLPAVAPNGGFDLNMYEEYCGSSGTATLGTGCFGMVKRYRHKLNDTVIAIKVVQKSFLIEHKMLDQMKREIQIHSTLKHPNIVSYLGHCETAEAFHLGMEFANGGHLFKKLRDNSKFSPRRTSFYLQHVLSALVKLHSLGLIHRDLKPENLLLFVDQDGNETLKLSDFGWSNEALVRKSLSISNLPGPQASPSNEARQTFCGTREYLSPEMLLAEPHSFALDLWGVGVLAFEMLTGQAPFSGSSIFSKILDGKIQFPSGLDPDSVHFIKQLLRRDPSERPSAYQALKHIFIKKYCGTPGRMQPSVNSTAIRHHNQHPGSDPGEDRAVLKQVDSGDARVEAIQLKSKLHILQKKYAVAQDQLISAENELDEQKAKLDRLMISIAPGLKNCLRASGLNPIYSRGSESSDIVNMVTQLSNCFCKPSNDNRPSRTSGTHEMNRSYDSSFEDDFETPVTSSRYRVHNKHNADRSSQSHRRAGPSHVRKGATFRESNSNKQRRRRAATKVPANSSRVFNSATTTTPSLDTPRRSTGIRHNRQARGGSSPPLPSFVEWSNVLATQVVHERERSRARWRSSSSASESYSVYSDSYSGYSEYSLSPRGGSQGALPAAAVPYSSTSGREVDSHHHGHISSKVLSISSNNNIHSRARGMQCYAAEKRVV